MKFLLVILGVCHSPSQCDVLPTQATVFEYTRFVDCVRAKTWVPEGLEAYCTGEAFQPPHITKG